MTVQFPKGVVLAILHRSRPYGTISISSNTLLFFVRRRYFYFVKYNWNNKFSYCCSDKPRDAFVQYAMAWYPPYMCYHTEFGRSITMWASVVIPQKWGTLCLPTSTWDGAWRTPKPCTIWSDFELLAEKIHQFCWLIWANSVMLPWTGGADSSSSIDREVHTFTLQVISLLASRWGELSWAE